MAGDLNFPHYEDKDFYKVISPQRAAKIALYKRRQILKHAESISLEYDQWLKCFVWEIVGERKYADSRKFEFWVVKVRANTGAIVGEQLKNGYRHVDYF